MQEKSDIRNILIWELEKKRNIRNERGIGNDRRIFIRKFVDIRDDSHRFFFCVKYFAKGSQNRKSF